LLFAFAQTRTSEYNSFGDFVPSSLIDVLLEECIFCDGVDDSFGYDVVSTIDKEDVSRSDSSSDTSTTATCSEEIEIIESANYHLLLSTVNQCNELKDRCIICHNNNNTSTP